MEKSLDLHPAHAVRISCSPIFPAPASSRHHPSPWSMSPHRPPVSRSTGISKTPAATCPGLSRHLSYLGSSSAQDSTPGLCFVGLRPGTLPGVQGHPSSACLTSALHDDWHHSWFRQTLLVSGTLLSLLVGVRSQIWVIQRIRLIKYPSGLQPPGFPSLS